ncbi:hypothetical protein HYALB_00011270 [Hymenoscyphus albidus]|uniref:Uncharacterized protein n=1 Tax=Hymenoscyphus albidus TaxID=595503 RepID=A0A9N9QAA5_9HELO|nr:hypothetical protein HYALB_00011270 [Hymenoscyphus albidus]
MFDARIWSMTLLFFCADMSAGSLSAFNPTILSQLGWTSHRAQVMTIPVWIIGIVGGLLTSLLSGRTNKRWPFILPAILISLLGWIIHYLHLSPPSIRYFAQFLISFGTFVQMPIYRVAHRESEGAGVSKSGHGFTAGHWELCEFCELECFY